MLSVLHWASVRILHVEFYVENIPEIARSEANIMTFASLDEAWYRIAVGSYAVLERQNSFNVHVSSRDSMIKNGDELRPKQQHPLSP